MARRGACAMLALLLGLGACDPTPGEVWPAGVAWQVEGDAWLTPAVDDSLVVFAGRRREVVAIDKRAGTVRWRAHGDYTGGMTLGNLLLVREVVVMPDGYLYGFERRTGALRYRVHTNDGYSPGHGYIATDDTLVFSGVPFGRVYAIDAESGVQRWRALVGPDEASVSGPAVGRDIVVVGTWMVGQPSTGALVALDRRTGVERWRRTFEPDPLNRSTGFSSVPVVVGETVVAAMDDGRIFGLHAGTGDLRWSVPRTAWPGPDSRHLTAVGATVYAASYSGNIVGIDAHTGTVGVTAVTGWGSILDPVAVNDRAVYALHLAGQVTASDRATGRLRWKRGELGEFTAPPATDGDRVYTGGSAWLWAFEP